LKAYYGSRFSPHMTRTPEGFLICHDVPIARTGWQEYLGQEVGVEELHDQSVQVHRSEDEVFSFAALASFESKPVTDEHPTEWVRPDNISSYIKGVTQNVRKGDGEDGDKVIADLVIYDPVLIAEIEHGKREISCGYDCVYEEIEKGEYKQMAIRGNHVAVVTSGRAGETVAIKDGRMETPLKTTKNRKNILARMFAAFAKDAAPEEIADAVEAMAEKEEDQEPPVTDGGEMLQKIMDRLDSLEARLADFQSAGADEEDPLEKLEKDLAGGEESVTVPADEMDEESIDEDPAGDEEETADEEGPVLPESALPDNPIPNADNKALLELVRSMKPVIARIKDKKEKKAVTDALVKSVKGYQGRSGKSRDGYKNILTARQKSAPVKDSSKPDDRQLGKDIAKKYNPHYKEVN